MCGIAGFHGHGRWADARRVDVAVQLRSMLGTIVHRGPDDQGEWHDPYGRCALGHRRLSIIDTSPAGHQPMATADGEWIITFNGEIYNFLDLRPALEANGARFSGRTDTEVLLHGIAAWGVDCFARLDGMFALAAFNTRTGELIAARDPFGEKPFYFAELEGGGLVFGSELQEIESVPGIDLEVSVDAVAELLMFQYTGAPRSIYRSIRKLPPGHWLRAKPGQPLEIGRYFEFRPGTRGYETRPLAELADELEALLVSSLRRRLIADVPLGAFLSGGVDSSTVCALARRRLDVPLKTFSIGFEGAPESEHETARAFAKHLGTEHQDRILRPDVREFLSGIGRILDEPNADSSCLPTWLLSRFTREQVTVAISGDGGDEMFAGYGRYFHTLDEDARHAGRAGWDAGAAYYSNRILVSVEEHVRELFGEVPAGTAAHVARLRQELRQPGVALVDRLRRTDVENYMPGAVLPKVDRMSMQHSLEVRTPFLNVEIARFAERLPIDVLYAGQRGKRILKEVAYRYLPREMIDLPKQGFGLPTSKWGTREVLEVATSLLESEDSRLRAALGSEAIDRFLRRQRHPQGFSTYQVWSIAVLESWLRHHPARFPAIERPPAVRPVASAAGPSTVAASPAGDAQGLVAVPVATGVVALLQPEDFQPANGSDPSPVPGLRSSAFQKLLQLAAHYPLASVQLRSGEAFRNPPVMEPLGPWLERPRRSPPPGLARLLRDAVLLVPRGDVALVLGHAQMEGLAAAGARAIVFPHPHRHDQSLYRITFNAKSPLQRRMHAMRLMRHGMGKLSLLASRGEAGHRVNSRLIGRLPPHHEREMSDQFMLFEGLRQMPPVPADHASIQTHGAGRYSIWSQHAIFSPSRRRRRAMPRWVIENNALTAPYLQYVPEVLKPADADTKQFLATLGQLIAADAAAPAAVPLEPGDAVVVLTHALPPGGAERQWCYLATELHRLGYRVTFVSVEELHGDGRHYLPMLEAAGVPVVETAREPISVIPDSVPQDPETLAALFASPFGARLFQASALFSRLRPKAVIAQLDYPNLLAASAAILAGVPRVVMSFRNYNPSNFSYLRNDWFLPLYQVLARSTRVRMSGNSRLANDDYADWMGVERKRVGWVSNALEAADLEVPDASARAALRATLRIDPRAPVVLGVFRLSEEKRPLLFIDLCGELAARVPGLRVLIAGVGPLGDAVAARVDELGLGSTISILGRREDIAALMSVSTMLLLASSFEGMPNVVMEAQALGLPVVAPRSGGVPDCVVDGRTGFVIPVDDHAGFCDASTRLLLDPALAARMGEEARAWARQQFAREHMARRYLEITSGPVDAG